MSTEPKIHPYASVFPETGPEDYKALRASINQYGLREPIVLLGEEILDGRTRYRACRELKIPPQFRYFNPTKDGQDPLAWVIDKNLNRRHLTVGQKAGLALVIAQLIKDAHAAAAAAPKAPTTPTPNDPEASDDDTPTLVVDGTAAAPASAPAEPGLTAMQQAAKAAGVSPRSAADMKWLQENDPARFDAVNRGEVKLHTAVAAARAEQNEATTAPSLPGVQTTIVNPYRSECADLMAASHGDKFAEAVRNDTILRDKELRDFMKLTIQTQQQITALVARGWKVNEAVKFAKGIFEKDDKIRELLNLAIMRKGCAVAKLDGHTILVMANELLEAQGPVADAIAAIYEIQQKPATITPEANAPKATKGGKQPEGSSAPTSSAPEPSSDGSKDGTLAQAFSKAAPVKGLKPKVTAKKAAKAPAKKK